MTQLLSSAAVSEVLRAEAWAMQPEKLEALVRALSSEAAAKAIEADLLAGPFSAPHPRELAGYDLRGGTAVVPVRGVLMRSVPSFFRRVGLDATATPEIRAAVEAAAADPRVHTIALHVDSPGGQAAGVLEVGDAVFAARQTKRVEAAVDTLGASGAYWIASQAHAITAAPDALVGSIGVYQVVTDFSQMAAREGVAVHVVRSGQHKGVGVMGAPVTPEHLAKLQSLVDGMADLFRSAVARGRGLSADQVKAIATGEVWLAGDARSQGLVDRVEPLAKAMSRLAPQEIHMSDPKTTEVQALEQARAAERKRHADLKAAFPRHAAFVDEQFQLGSTVEQAKVAFIPVLERELEDEKKASASAREEAAKAKTAIAPPPAAAPLPRGVDPRAVAPLGDFRAVVKARASERRITVVEAMRQVAQEQPELHASFKTSCAERATEIARRKLQLKLT